MISLLFWNLLGGMEENYEKPQNNQRLGNLFRDFGVIQETSMCLISDNDDILLLYSKSMLCIPLVNILLCLRKLHEEEGK
jgi:hypothetical protein